MPFAARPQPSRWSALLLACLVTALVAAPTRAATSDLTVGQAEARLIDLLNQDRASAGLVPLRVDGRLMAIARARSTDMATKHYFSHTQPDGRDVFDYIVAARVAWSGAGEALAWNNHPTLTASAASTNNQWLGSPGHRKLVMSTSYNYVGVGVALDRSTSRYYWTAVFLRGPEWTGPRPAIVAPRPGR